MSDLGPSLRLMVFMVKVLIFEFAFELFMKKQWLGFNLWEWEKNKKYLFIYEDDGIFLRMKSLPPFFFCF